MICFAASGNEFAGGCLFYTVANAGSGHLSVHFFRIQGRFATNFSENGARPNAHHDHSFIILGI